MTYKRVLAQSALEGPGDLKSRKQLIVFKIRRDQGVGDARGRLLYWTEEKLTAPLTQIARDLGPASQRYVAQRGWGFDTP